jgi:hypothetical protein
MVASPRPHEVNDTFESMLAAFGNEEEPPVKLEQFTQVMMRIVYQAFDRLQDPDTGLIIPEAVEEMHGMALRAYVSRSPSPAVSAASPALSAAPSNMSLGTAALSAQNGSEGSAAEAWKEHMRVKRVTMRGRSPASSAANSPALNPAASPAGSVARSRSSERSPANRSASPPPLPPAPAEMTFEGFTHFVMSELQCATEKARYHEALALVYRVGTGI